MCTKSDDCVQQVQSPGPPDPRHTRNNIPVLNARLVLPSQEKFTWGKYIHLGLLGNISSTLNTIGALPNKMLDYENSLAVLFFSK